MIRPLIALIAIAGAAVIAPAEAQDNLATAGRYQLAPGEGSSFVRLDTRTGAVSHCGQEAGVWRCEPIVDSDLKDELSVLSDKIDTLSADLDRLSLRVDTLAAEAAPATAATEDKAADAPRGFAQAVVYRLLEMIRTLKHSDAGTT